MHECLNCKKTCRCHTAKLSVCSETCKNTINPRYRPVVKVCGK